MPVLRDKGFVPCRVAQGRGLQEGDRQVVSLRGIGPLSSALEDSGWKPEPRDNKGLALVSTSRDANNRPPHGTWVMPMNTSSFT